ncbi:hypothetical protein PLEOSDRAFT_156619 [Pleurotus ostreatus PC15]|uniref:Mid2 domain-containing protein n=1 Tax=Pleurotus ostreatus (strain PC15) TaxID=1137138 RepID=A0A067NXM1_PLEO1|nr:hypothetical protein PLEOSDRAFT_156619 [Pleurotus ostreatus PC15]
MGCAPYPATRCSGGTAIEPSRRRRRVQLSHQFRKRDRHGVGGGDKSDEDSSDDEDSGDEDSGDEDSDEDSDNGRKSKIKSKTTTSQTSKPPPVPPPAGPLPPPVAPAPTAPSPSPSSTPPATLTPTPPPAPLPTPMAATLTTPTTPTVAITPTPPSSGIVPGEQSSSTTSPSVLSVQTTIITSSQSQAVIITSDSGIPYTSSMTSSEPSKLTPTNNVEPQRRRSDRLPIILGSVSGALGLFVVCLLGWLIYARRRRRKRRRSLQVNWDHFYEWKSRYSSGSIVKVEELEEETLEEGKTPRWPEPQEGRPISARLSSLRHSIPRRSSREPSPRRKSAVSAVGIDDDTSATKTNFAVTAPSAPLPVYHPLGIQNIPSAQELSVPQYYHSHQPASPLFAPNTFDDILRGVVSHNIQAVSKHQDRQ